MNERRSSPRWPATLPSPCFLHTAGGLPIGGAVLLNLSAGGLALYTSGRLEAGERIGAELMGGPVALRRLPPLQVVHVQPQPSGFHVGGQFLHPLTEIQLKALTG